MSNLCIAFKKSPCAKCEVRHEGCHGKCEKYNAWRMQYIKKKNIKREKKREENL